MKENQKRLFKTANRIEKKINIRVLSSPRVYCDHHEDISIQRKTTQNQQTPENQTTIISYINEKGIYLYPDDSIKDLKYLYRILIIHIYLITSHIQPK